MPSSFPIPVRRSRARSSHGCPAGESLWQDLAGLACSPPDGGGSRRGGRRTAPAREGQPYCPGLWDLGRTGLPLLALSQIASAMASEAAPS